MGHTWSAAALRSGASAKNGSACCRGGGGKGAVSQQRVV